jgi:hypothetical protein
MDVNFKFPIKDEKGNTIKTINFRASLKNWDQLSGRDFGETSVGSALIRTIGAEGIINDIFIPILSKEEDIKQYRDNAHQIAQISLLVDILMGYSQENNYADTIIINERSKKTIKVISIQDVLDNLKEKLNLKDYDGRKVTGKIIKGRGKENYYNNIYNELLDLKVALRYSDL